MVRSPPGNIVVITLFVYYAMNCDSGTFINNGTGPKRKIVDINSCNLPAEQRSAIIGLYCFSGQNYLSSFFRKGRTTYWNKACENADHISTFSFFGRICYVNLELTEHIEKYVYCWRKVMRIIKLLNSACFEHAIETLSYTYDDPNMWHMHYDTLKVSNSILIHPLFMVWGKLVRLVDKYFPHNIQDILIAVNQKQGVKKNELRKWS